MTTDPARGHTEQLDLRSIAAVVVLAFGTAWLVALPLWLGVSPRTSWSDVIRLVLARFRN